MKIYNILICLFIITLSPLIIFAEEPLSPPVKVKECNFPDNMNCFQNRDIADAEEVNANFQALVNQIKELTEIICSYKPNHKVCLDQKTIIRNSLGMTFVRIPAGSFMMGSPIDEPGRESNETLHEVTFTKSFYMQTTEVTQGQWKAVMGNNPSHFSECGDNCPVENVSWNNIQEFITKLNASGEKKYRLPTEAEWEYSARAGTKSAFFWGQCLSTDQANYNGNSLYSGGCPKGVYREKTIPVASFFPNSFGLYDMYGNVWEWCLDWFEQTSSSNSVIDPQGPDSGTMRNIRGGGYLHGADHCRSAYRGRNYPDFRFLDLGFRLILDNAQ